MKRQTLTFPVYVSLGIAEFTDGVLTDTYESLIDPETYFDSYNISIHGINENKVFDKPTFEHVYDKLKELEDCIVLHHSSFDRSAYRQACEKYNLNPTDLIFLDTSRVVRRT